MEGVMMQGPDRIAIAMRLPSGELYLKTSAKPAPKAWAKIPLVRGVFAFVQSLVTGTSTLMESADILEKYAPEEYSEGSGKFEKWMDSRFGPKATWNFLMVMSVILAMVITIVVFVLFPTWAVNLLGKWIKNAIVLNLIEGVLRILMFIAYVMAIRKMPDIRTLFRYHGSEHKTIHCFENGLELTPENAQQFYTLHPRCGTSFLMFVLIISLLLFSFLGWPDLMMRFLSRLLLLPVIAGISYELLKWAGRSNGKIVRILSYPGLMLQKMTTDEPTLEQLEVAILSLKAVLPGSDKEFGEGFVDADGNWLDNLEEFMPDLYRVETDDGEEKEDKGKTDEQVSEQQEKGMGGASLWADTLCNVDPKQTFAEIDIEKAEAASDVEDPEAAYADETAEPEPEDAYAEETAAAAPEDAYAEETAAAEPEDTDAEETAAAEPEDAYTEETAAPEPEDAYAEETAAPEQEEATAEEMHEAEPESEKAEEEDKTDREGSDKRSDSVTDFLDGWDYARKSDEKNGVISEQTPAGAEPEKAAAAEIERTEKKIPEKTIRIGIADMAAAADAETMKAIRNAAGANSLSIEKALRWGQLQLLRVENGKNEAAIIFSYVTGMTRSQFITRAKEPIAPDRFAEYEKRIRVRLKGVPLQYIVGVQEFMGLQFRVNKHVLIPRMDTEVLVENTLRIAAEKKMERPEILDMCTGSGAIGISLARKIENAIVTLTDVSEEALRIADANAHINEVNRRCMLLLGDMFEAVPQRAKYDIITCNPPYIESRTIDTLATEVKDYEPRLALDGGTDGLDFYRVIAEEAGKHLRPGGVLVLEIGNRQARAVRKLLDDEEEYRKISVVKDLAGHDRVVIAER